LRCSHYRGAGCGSGIFFGLDSCLLLRFRLGFDGFFFRLDRLALCR
jgi:hypothetical protein